ncbi:Phosphomethylpyrimidine kinase type-1 [uncultured delta proteobacterium]|uniref:pyridoxal kinase n=1 Tax=uncultured delta proteobacterium TaxID=34034 RepID=A0A212JHP5_9DELT|nr:Phosphomethylpyrimidine kinase type-1 [uncultured delta proteobacterium]
MRSPLTSVAAIHDLSGFGRTSLAVAIPILSTMGAQVYSLPTAVLSSETGAFDDFVFVDLTHAMAGFLDHWDRLGAKFDAVYSGFLGSPAQVDLVARCIENNLLPGGFAVVDPVLGDNGALDATMTDDMVERMRWLVTRAHCITPNLTEAAFLLGEKFPDKELSVGTLREWLARLGDMGPEKVIITSASSSKNGHKTAVAAYDRPRDMYWQVACDYIPAFYPGTGDTFASVVTGSLLQGDSLPVAIDRAAQFVTLGIKATFGHDLPTRNGILLERVLRSLNAPMTASTYTLL